MEKVLEFWAWLQANYQNVLITIGAFVAFLEAFVRLTPTKKDDGAVHRIGNMIDWLFDLAKIPNVHKINTFKKEDKPSDPEITKPV